MVGFNPCLTYDLYYYYPCVFWLFLMVAEGGFDPPTSELWIIIHGSRGG